MARTKMTFAMPIDPQWAKEAIGAYKALEYGAAGPLLDDAGISKQTMSRVVTEYEEEKELTATFDTMEKLRLALARTKRANLPPVVMPMRSMEHARWAASGVDANAELIEWAEIGRRLQSQGKLRDALSTARMLAGLPASPQLGESSEEIPIVRSNSAALRSNEADASDHADKKGHGTRTTRRQQRRGAPGVGKAR